jgi:hypothetical protein
MARFNLSKWYLDCIADSGATSIFYAGSVSWGEVQLRYSSLTDCEDGQVSVRSSIRNRLMPEINGTSVSWHAQELGIDAAWEADSAPLRETIFSSDQGSVDWHCLMPRARTRFRERFGLGYVEQLTMSLPPWQLPIEKLHWGRFTSASDWAVWIDWRGKFSRRVVYLNGEVIATPLLEDGCISFDDGTQLTMDRSLLIRDAPLGTGALSKIPGIRRVFPVRLLDIREKKWRSRAYLVRTGKPGIAGWAIHECVSWPE